MNTMFFQTSRDMYWALEVYIGISTIGTTKAKSFLFTYILEWHLFSSQLKKDVSMLMNEFAIKSELNKIHFLF